MAVHRLGDIQNMTDIAQLIRDIEAATGPDRALDERIALEVGWAPETMSPLWSDSQGLCSELPNFTGSLDAARGTFGDHPYDMEPDWDNPCRKRCTIIDDARRALFRGTGATEPLAMCAAAMRLKQKEG